MFRRLTTDVCTMLLLMALGASLPLSERAGTALLQLAADAASADQELAMPAVSAHRQAQAGAAEIRLAEAIFGVERH